MLVLFKIALSIVLCSLYVGWLYGLSMFRTLLKKEFITKLAVLIPLVAIIYLNYLIWG